MSLPSAQQRIPPPNVTIPGNMGPRGDMFPSPNQLPNSVGSNIGMQMNQSPFPQSALQQHLPLNSVNMQQQLPFNNMAGTIMVTTASLDVPSATPTCTGNMMTQFGSSSSQNHALFSDSVKNRQITMQQQQHQVTHQIGQVNQGPMSGSMPASSDSQMLMMIQGKPVMQQQEEQPQEQLPPRQLLADKSIGKSILSPETRSQPISHSHPIPQSSTPQPQSQQQPIQQPPRAASVPGACLQNPIRLESQENHSHPGIGKYIENSNDSSSFPAPDSAGSSQPSILSSVASSTTETLPTYTAAVSSQGQNIGKNLDRVAEIQAEMESLDTKSDVNVEIKTETKVEIKQEPMDDSTSVFNSGSVGNKEETASIKEEPTTPMSTASASDTSLDIKQEPVEQPIPKLKPNEKVFKPDELRQALRPTLEKLYRQDLESLAFRQPVDPHLLQIPW